MGRKKEFKGKDIDEAITNACKALALPREELDIEIISTGSAGIFGLCRKQAAIRVAKKEVSLEVEVDAEFQAARADTPDKKVTPPKTPAPAEKIPVSEPAPPPAPAAEKEKPAASPREKGKERDKKTFAPLPDEIISEIGQDLGELLRLMHFPSEIETDLKNNKYIFNITGEFTDELTANDGQVLDSLQYLMRKIIGKKYSQKIQFALDAGNFRENRRNELEELALKLAAEVKESGKTRTISPLNPAERRIVHLVLQDDKTIRSRSVGEGLFKKILIYLPGKGRKRPPRRRAKKN